MTNDSQPGLLGHYQRSLLVLRTFLGVVYLSNGLAKLVGWHNVTIGPWKSYLIDRPTALGIQTANSGSAPGFLKDLGKVVVDNWGVLQWVLTFGELAVGIGLLLGVLGRLSASVGILLAMATFIFTLGAGGWTYDYLFEPVGLLVIALAPALPGLGSRVPWVRSDSRLPGHRNGAAGTRPQAE